MAADDTAGNAGRPADADFYGAPRLNQQKILQACQQQAERYAAGLFKEVVEKLDDVLFERGNKGGPAAEEFINAARELRLKYQELFDAFSDNFIKTYKSRLQHATFAAGVAKDRVHDGGLSLVDEQDLEESLAVDGLVAKANDRLRSELFALAQRFNHLITGAQYRDEAMPLSPDALVYGFRDAIQSMAWKVQVKLVVYKLFEQHALRSLGDFYHEANKLLRDAGVLPTFKPALGIRTPAGPERSAAADPHEADEVLNNDPSPGQQPRRTPSPGDGAAAAADVYQTLQRLMNARKFGDAAGEGGSAGRGGVGGAAAGEGAAPAVPTDDLVRGLSLLQQDGAASDGGVLTIHLIKDALLDQMRQIGDGRGIGPAHDNTIDVIGMIFEFILDESSIPDVVKNLLNRLQIPILKVAIVDKAFFTNKTHPARRLLNVLGHASIGWNDNKEEARQRRFEKMEYVVQQVLAEFEQDPGIFGQLLDEFTAFLAGEGAETGEEPPEAEEKQAAASTDRLAFVTIEAQLEGAELPDVLRVFLRDTWRDVLQHALDRGGPDGDAWRRRQQALDDLMWSVEPKTTADDRRKMVTLLPRLLDELRDGMIQIERGQAETHALLDALEPIHMACLRGERPALDAPKAGAGPPSGQASSSEVAHMIRSIQEGMSGGDADLLTEAAMEEEGVPPADEMEAVGQELDDEFTAMAADMPLGAWLEFTFEDKKRRGKLAWKSAVMGEYVFVDRKYKVVAERTLAGLADDLRQGRASLVEDVAMFDRALDKVLNGLMAGG